MVSKLPLSDPTELNGFDIPTGRASRTVVQNIKYFKIKMEPLRCDILLHLPFFCALVELLCARILGILVDPTYMRIPLCVVRIFPPNLLRSPENATAGDTDTDRPVYQASASGFRHFWKGVRGKTIRQLTSALGKAAAEGYVLMFFSPR